MYTLHTREYRIHFAPVSESVAVLVLIMCTSSDVRYPPSLRYTTSPQETTPGEEKKQNKIEGKFITGVRNITPPWIDTPSHQNNYKTTPG